MYVKFYAGRNGRAYDHPGCIMEWGNIPMNRRIYKIITREMRYQMAENPEADLVIALVYTGMINSVSMGMNRSGLINLVTYHPGQMDAVMSICTVRRGGGIA